MRRVFMAVQLILSLSLAGCVGTQSVGKPDFYPLFPDNPEYMYGVSSQSSYREDKALSKAVEAAWAQIGREAQIKVEGLRMRFLSETDTWKDSLLTQLFEQLERKTLEPVFRRSHIVKTEFVDEGRTWRVYVLVKAPLGALSKSVLEQIRTDKYMYSKLHDCRAFKDLQSEARKYEKSRREEGTETE